MNERTKCVYDPPENLGDESGRLSLNVLFMNKIGLKPIDCRFPVESTKSEILVLRLTPPNVIRNRSLILGVTDSKCTVQNFMANGSNSLIPRAIRPQINW